MSGLSDIFEIARACGKPKRSGKGVSFLCPCHQDKNPSCHASVGEVAILVHCYAGCERGDVMDALRAMGFTLSLREREVRRARDLARVKAPPRVDVDRDTKWRRELAVRLWNEAR